MILVDPTASRRSFFAALAFAVLLGGGCSSPSEGDVPARRTPIVLISIDTLRADRLPPYGYRGVETPALDAFRRDAVLFERAWSHSPLTLPSHATMLTGVLPSRTGVRDNLGFRLRDDLPTLAEALGRAGYATGAAVSAFVLRRETGIARGFDSFDDDVDVDPQALSLGAFQRDGNATASIAARWIAARAAAPLFYFLHLYEPHTPYAPPEPFRSRYPASPYDAEIAAADAILGRFLDSLRHTGLYDDALIIVTSDHGEGLGDHGEEEHGIFLYREAIQVPLLVKFPRGARAGTSASVPVQLTDLAPTILETAGLEVPQGLDGTSLTRLLDGDRPPRAIYSETFYPRLHFGWSDLHSIVSGDHHYIAAPHPELYDLRSDPRERTNLRETDRRTAFALAKAIEPLVVPANPVASIDPEEARKLAALGYLGSAAVASEEHDLPDPKERIGSLTTLKRAFALAQEERFAAALPLLDELAAENPRMLDVADLRARALARLGRPAEALEAARHALRLAPSTSHLQIMIAGLALEMGRIEEAERHAELALESEPAQAREILARAALERGDLESAARHAEALGADARFTVPRLMTLARVRVREGRPNEALALLDQIAAAKGTDVPQSYHFLRGDALARLGRFAEAERELLAEIERHPREPQPYKNLVLLLLTIGEEEKASDLLFRLEREAPTPRTYAAIVDLLETIGDRRGAEAWARRGGIRR